MSKLILSAFADEYADSLKEQCEALNKFGIKNIELRGVNGKNVSLLTKKEAKEVKKTLDAYDIKVSSIGSPIGKVDIKSALDTHFEMAKRIFNTANILGTKNVRIFSFYSKETPFEESKNEIYMALEKLLSLSDSAGLTLCHENEALIYGESPEKCLEIVKYFNGRIKCVFDMGNFVLDGYEPISAYKMLFNYIEYFHIKDALYAGAIVPPGKGEAKIKEILDDWKKNNKTDTFITLEPHLETFSGINTLVGKSFNNPYKYNNQKEAFIDAMEKLKGLL